MSIFFKLLFIFSAYGAIADIDIESEVLRSLGEFRFTIFTLLRVAKLRKYKAKLWYKPVKKPTTQSLKSDDETILDDTGSEPTTMEHMEEGEETIKFKEALEPESEIEEDSSDKEDSATNEGTESVKGTFFPIQILLMKNHMNYYLSHKIRQKLSYLVSVEASHHIPLHNGTIHFTIHSTFWS